MNIDKFNALKQKLEVNAFESNFFTLDKVLYYFSFLGNVFSVIFSYFFIKDALKALPEFFAGQDTIVAISVITFMSGYELLKRFSFKQLIVYIFRLKKFTLNLMLGGLMVTALVVGSFYLSLNGAHRLIDQTEVIENFSDSLLVAKKDSVWNYYKQKIDVYEEQKDKIYASTVSGRISSRFKQDLEKYEEYIKNYEQERDASIAGLEEEFLTETTTDKSKNKSNTVALVLITLFMELIILLGVGFNAYYVVTSYSDMKRLMTTPKYKRLQDNLHMLHLLYQNGNKKEGERTLPLTKFKSLVANSKLNVRVKDITDFLNMCSELNIINVGNGRKKYYSMDYEKAREIMTNQM